VRSQQSLLTCVCLVTKKMVVCQSVLWMFTGDRFIGVVNFTSVLVEDDVLQHCDRNINIQLGHSEQRQSML
jgi:hypothetical protein